MRHLHVPTARASTWPAAVVAASVLGAVVLRVPFMHTGLGPDEGGYAYVADQWARGARLYGPSAWVDRPQGLLLVYRGLLSLAHGPWAVRLGAVVFGAAITLLLGAIGCMLKDAWTGAAAAAIYAVVGVAPHVQGFTFNGELAAALPVAGSIAAALAWRKTRGAAWLVGAGLCGGAALLMKQSGFDGLLVAAGVVYSVRPRRWRTGATFAGAAAVPPALSALHGLSVGWSNYWFAVAWYKLDAHSGADASLTGRLGRMATSWVGARRDLELLVLVALAGVGCALLRRPPLWLPVGWLLAAFAGFNAASLYWPHYYVQLLAPLALLAGIAATSVPARPSVRILVVGVAVWQVLPYLIRLDEMSSSQRQVLVPYFHQYVSDERVARAVRASSGLHDSIYALDSEADLYLLADRRAAFPYLWAHPLDEIPGAMARLRALLDGKGHPRLVIVYRPPTVVDPSGRLGRILHDDYRVQERVPSADATILRSSSA